MQKGIVREAHLHPRYFQKNLGKLHNFRCLYVQKCLNGISLIERRFVATQWQQLITQHNSTIFKRTLVALFIVNNEWSFMAMVHGNIHEHHPAGI